MSAATDTAKMNFNPSWMGSTFSAGAGNTGQADQSTILAPPKMAKNKYGREELLALREGMANENPPDELPQDFAHFYVHEPTVPICIQPFTDVEERLLHHVGINSSKAMSAVREVERSPAPFHNQRWSQDDRTERPQRGAHYGGRGGGVGSYGSRGGAFHQRGLDREHETTRFSERGRGRGGGHIVSERGGRNEGGLNPRAQGLYDPKDPRDRPRARPRTTSTGEGASGYSRGGGRPYGNGREQELPEWAGSDDEIGPDPMTEDGTFDDQGQFRKTILDDAKRKEDSPTKSEKKESSVEKRNEEKAHEKQKHESAAQATDFLRGVVGLGMKPDEPEEAPPAPPVADQRKPDRTGSTEPEQAAGSREREIRMKLASRNSQTQRRAEAAAPEWTDQTGQAGPAGPVKSERRMPPAPVQANVEHSFKFDELKVTRDTKDDQRPQRIDNMIFTNKRESAEGASSFGDIESSLVHRLVTASQQSHTNKTQQAPAQSLEALLGTLRPGQPATHHLPPVSLPAAHQLPPPAPPLMQPAASHAPPSAPQDQQLAPNWFYLDPKKEQQGPFKASQMNKWLQAGYFTPDLLLRNEKHNRYNTLAAYLNEFKENLFIESHRPVPAVAQPPATNLGFKSIWGDDVLAGMPQLHPNISQDQLHKQQMEREAEKKRIAELERQIAQEKQEKLQAIQEAKRKEELMRRQAAELELRRRQEEEYARKAAAERELAERERQEKVRLLGQQQAELQRQQRLQGRGAGIPAPVPVKVRLPVDSMKQLIHSSDLEETSEDSDVEGKKGGLRGSAASGEVDEAEGDNNFEHVYNMQDYDNNDVLGDTKRSMMTGIASFANPMDDPYIQQHEDSDTEDDDYRINGDDSLLLVGKINKDQYGLEVYVYNEREDSFYVHHDYILDCAPVCIEAIHCDPGNTSDQQNTHGNLAAIGSMKSVVDIWDVDIVDSLEPIVTLGNKEKGKEPSKKKKKCLRHSDAVLDLNWNLNLQHLLLSASADATIIVWDLDTAQGCVQLHQEGKVQSVQWHTCEANIAVSGCSSGHVTVWDGRSSEAKRRWKVEGEVEKVMWMPSNPFMIVACTDGGDLYCIDSRNEDISFCTPKVHKDTISDISVCPHAKNCVVTCSQDETIKVWDISDSKFTLVASKKVKMDGLFCCTFCPDAKSILAVGGQKGDFVRTIDLTKIEGVADHFDFKEIAESETKETQ